MALHFNVSNNLVSLSQSLIDHGKHNLSVFQPFMIITQTSGMNNWLTSQIARNLGIAANIQYVQPAQFIYEVYQLLLEERVATISRNNVDLLIYQALSEDKFKQRFPNQYQYFVEHGNINEVKKWELASKVADLFDQYQVYRHDIIQLWNHEEYGDIDKKFEWQYYLWNRIKSLSGTYFPDITEMHRQILKWLEIPEKTEKLKYKYPRIHLFGLSIVTKLHIQIIYKLSEHIDFHFYLLNPAPEVLWEYDLHPNMPISNTSEYMNIGNPLLTGWGKILRSTSQLLFNDDAIFNLRNEIGVTYPEPTSLLKCIQRDIAENQPTPSPIPINFLHDQSIIISSTYSIQSEIESLYNYLLDLTQISSINEKEILVIVTDINRYAPYIRAVFDNAPYHFQYSIADESIITSDSFVAALAALLSIEPHPFAAEEILDLFQFSIIRKKFGIENLSFIRKAIEIANIRYGIHNNEIDDTHLVSWSIGLKRIMYGVCMEEDTLIELNNEKILSTSITDQQQEMHQLFKLCDFVDKLMQQVKHREKNRNFSGWKSYVEDIIRTFLNDESSESEEKTNNWIEQQLQFEYMDDLLKNDQIPFEVFKKRLEARLQHESSEGKFLNRGITFCSPLPFRSIPFKVVAFLGLNMNDFPRKESFSELDLIKSNYQLDDRNIRENDKHLFLESLLSAEEKFYLSYIGKSNKDNTKLPPSILVDELLDYIQEAIGDEAIDVRKHLIEQKPLHLYSKKYNQSNAILTPNYFIKKHKAFPIKIPSTIDSYINSNEEKVVSINEILSFAKNSIKYYYNNALNIYIGDNNSSIDPVEEFALSPLISHKIADQLIKNKISLNLKSEETIEKWHHLGILPLRNMEDVSLHPIIDNYELIINKLNQLIPETNFQTIKVDLDINSQLKIVGKIPYLNNNILFAFHPFDKVKNAHLFTWLLNYHLANSISNIEKMIILTPSQNFEIDNIEVSKSINTLFDWAQYTYNGKHNLNCFGLDLITDKNKISEDDFEKSFENVVEKNLSYDPYLNIAIQKGQHKNKVTEFFNLKRIFFTPLEVINSTN